MSGDTVGVWVHSPVLRAEVARAAAAASVRVIEADRPVPTEGQWARAGVVVLGPVAAEACMQAGYPRRRGVLVVVESGQQEASAWRCAVRLGAQDVLQLPEDAPALLQSVAHGDGSHAPDGGGGVITVASGHGGAGASVLSAAVALAAPRDSLLVDLDPTGPGLDLLLGVERQDGLRWPELRLHQGRVDAAALHRALPSRAATTVLAACSADAQAEPPLPGAARSVLRSGRSSGGTVVCDISHQRTEAAVAAIEEADMTVLVVAADVPSCAAASRAARWITGHTADAALVVRGPSPGGLRGGDVESALGLPLLASMRPEPGLGRRLESGGLEFARRSPLRAAARAVHRVHARRPAAGAA